MTDGSFYIPFEKRQLVLYTEYLAAFFKVAVILK